MDRRNHYNDDIVLDHRSDFPLILRPASSALDITAWARKNADWLKQRLHKQGAILFRGFGLNSSGAFTTLAKAVCPTLNTEYGELDQEEPAAGVYGSTVYPVDHPIHFHNESAHSPTWPLYMFFFCQTPSLEGGATRLVDTRRVLQDLDPVIRDQFRRESITYMRNHYPQLDTRWEIIFGTDDPREAERHCLEMGVEFRWQHRDTLQTRITLPPILNHPLTQEEVLFHQLFLFHPACLDPETRGSLGKIYDTTDLPRSVAWSSGRSIQDDVVKQIFSLYEKHAVDLIWEAGDVVILDNALIAHGRLPFKGPRKIMVAMGNMVQNPPVRMESHPKEFAHYPDPTLTIEDVHYDPVHKIFQSHVVRTPEAIAISQSGKRWSYKELNAQALRTAGALQQVGLRRGTPVAIAGPCSFEVVAAMLGAWMNGQALVPLDPDLPMERRETMLDEAGAEIILSANGVSSGARLHLNLNEIPHSIPSSVQLPEIHAASPAYIFFTSGTTGLPKGIIGTHKGLAHFLHWQRNTFDLSPEDRIAQLTGLSFDVVLRDIFLALTSGATLCLPPETRDPTNPWSWLCGERISRLHAVPSLASIWLANAPIGAVCDTLRTVFFAGEPLTDSHVRRWRAAISKSLEIVNLYGPTETTLAKCYYRVPDLTEPGVQPIGEPLPGTQILIVNDEQKLCAQGETGEIVIRSPYRTLGYLRTNGVHGSRFASNPFGTDPDDIVYYTGDLGRFRPDGMLDILGRKDDQIKVLGVRIEPQEIASLLTEYPHVRQAFVTKSLGERPGLFAFLVADEVAAPARALTAFLAERLPSTMIPHRFVYLDHLPLTANGKVDRRALLQRLPDTAASVATLAPRSAAHQLLAQLWRDLLRVETVELQDNFFDLGGQSLLAMQLVSRVREHFDVAIQIQHVFENPTLETLAACILELMPANEERYPSPVRRSESNDRLPVSFAQQRLWFLTKLEPGKGVYNIPGAIRFVGSLDPNLLQSSINTLVTRHASLRTWFGEEDGVPYQVLDESASLEIEHRNFVAKFDSNSQEELRQVAREITLAPIDLGRAPLARAILLQMSESEYVLVYTLHHTIADGWSNAIFNRELQRLYASGGNQTAAMLPSLTLDHVDHAIWERKLFHETAQQQLAFYKERLSGAPAYLRLPTDRPRPAVQTFNGASCLRTLPKTLTASLIRAFPYSHTTLFIKLLTVFKVLLYQLSGERDLIVGTPIARRTHREFESVMGCFLNTLAIRSKVPKDATFEQFLEIVRASTLEGFAHQDVPFDKVVESVGPLRNPSHHPLFQVLFNYLYFEEPATPANDVTMQREWLVDPETKFDMTLYVRELRDRINLQVVYNADLFDHDRIERLLEQYQSLVEQFIVDPQKIISVPPEISTCDHGDVETSRPAIRDEESVRSSTEIALTDIWREVLAVDSVGRKDNFFALGGHSLLAMKLLSRIGERFAVSLQVRNILEHPTVHELSHYIDRVQDRSLQSISRGDHRVLSPDQAELWEMHRAGADEYYYNMPRAVRFKGLLDLDILRASLDALFQRHSVLRTTYEDTLSGPRIRVRDITRVPLKVVDLSRMHPVEQEEREQTVIHQEARHQFDLENDLPIRITLLRRDTQDHTLVVTAHQIAIDCWCLGFPFQTIVDRDDRWHPGIFFNELSAIYSALRDQRPMPFSDLPIEFRDFAHWQTEQLQRGGFAEHAGFWKGQLDGAPRDGYLPADFPRSSQQTLAGTRYEFGISNEISSDLDRFRREHRTSLFVPLLSAFAMSLYGWSGEADRIIGTPVANRDRPETEHLIGRMANVLALRIAIDDRIPVSRLIGQVRGIVRESFAHQDYPFPQIVRDLCGTNSYSSPIFQVRFVLQQAAQNSPNLPDLAIAPVRFDRGVSKHDLSLIVAVQGSRLRGWCEYSTSLFQSSTIEEFAKMYLRTLSAMVRNPGKTVETMMTSVDAEGERIWTS